jgi:hypothetical protein
MRQLFETVPVTEAEKCGRAECGKSSPSMAGFHNQTLALLGKEGRRRKRSVETLIRCARKNSGRLPAAFVEWAELDDGSLLSKYRNDDSFWLDRPELVVTPDGIRGLRFNSENQSNFDRIVTLDQGDDPPVLFAWIGPRSNRIVREDVFPACLDRAC